MTEETRLTLTEIMTELKAINVDCQETKRLIVGEEEDDKDELWAAAYENIFATGKQERALELIAMTGLTFQYTKLDGTTEEKVVAFIDALSTFVEGSPDAEPTPVD